MPHTDTALANTLFLYGLGDGKMDGCPSPDIHHLYATHLEAGYSLRVRQIGSTDNPLNVAIGAMRGQPLSILGAWKKTDVFLNQTDIRTAIRCNAKDQHYLACKQKLVNRYTYLYVPVVLGVFSIFLLFDITLGLQKLWWAMPVVAGALWACLPLGKASADSVHNEKWAESYESELLALL